LAADKSVGNTVGLCAGEILSKIQEMGAKGQPRLAPGSPTSAAMNPSPLPGQNRKELQRLLKDLRALVLLHRELGIADYPASPALHRFLKPSPPRQQGRDRDRAGTGVTALPQRPAAGATPGPESGAAVTAGAQPSLTALEEQAGHCRLCPRGRQHQRIIFGQGNPQARLLLIGQAPGPEEEAAGLPFQGPAGELLDRMLAAIKLDRDQVYLTTLVKCAQPDRLPPNSEEIQACLPLLLQQIAALQPRLICTLGPLPAQALLRSRRNLLQLRGRFHQWQGIDLMPTLAPDFLLLHPEMKKAAWQDLQLIQKKLGRR
jgi:uracil-DNA glycosylase